LTDFFVARYSRKYNRPLRPISDELRQLFLQYDWPGNIRELENMIKRVVILQDEHLVVREIERNLQRHAAAHVAVAAPVAVAVGAGIGVPAGVGALPGGFPPAVDLDAEEPDDAEPAVDENGGGSLAAVSKAASMKAERAAIEHTLRVVHWNRRKAAQSLGVSYKTLLNKIKECGISRV
jgi:two-component system, NtrC family, response regulator AtoC